MYKSKGQVINGTINGKYIYENSNFINGECIICTHNIVGNNHKDTRLSSWKNGVVKPILRDFDFGLEDAFWLQNINGYDWLWAEKKPYNNSQRNISFFRAISGTHDWKFLYDIKPISDFEKASVSSPTVNYENGIFEMIYEGRPTLTIPGVNDYRVGYLEINPDTLKILNRSTKPIFDDRLVPDDFTGIKISGHRQDIPYESLWLSVVYKYKNGKWIKDYEPKVDGKRVGEFYFNGYYYKEQYGGMWKWKESQSPKPNGKNMKPQRLLFDGKILSCDDIPTASRFDAYATGGFQYDLISSRFSRFNNRVSFMNIADKFIKGKGQEFWIIAEVDGVKYISNRLKFGEPEPPEPNNNEIYKANIEDWTHKILLEVDKIK